MRDPSQMNIPLWLHFFILNSCALGVCHYRDTERQGARSPWRVKSCTVAPDICGSSVWKLLHVVLLAPRILRCFLDIWKTCASQCYYISLHNLLLCGLEKLTAHTLTPVLHLFEIFCYLLTQKQHLFHSLWVYS